MTGFGTDSARAAALLVLATACTSTRTSTRTPSALAVQRTFAADSESARTVAPGVVLRTLHVARGPWTIHVLVVDATRCWTLEARKAGGGAVGRTGTLELARELESAGRTVAGAVNADFFALTAPQGVTQGLHVEHGMLVTGPNAKPSLAIDSMDVARITTFAAYGSLVRGRDSVPIVAWNRATTDAGAAALYDARYGARTDSGPARTFVHLVRVPSPTDARERVSRIDTGAATTIAPNERVLAVLRDSTLRGMRAGDTVSIAAALAPWGPRDAVSGRGLLLQHGALSSDVEGEGAASFRGRNPRTAVGLARGRFLLVVVDGRQKPWSDGMTLRELASLFQSLGATDALNLDGGGSSTLVARDASGALAIVNRPSDKTERAVGNALAVVRGCATRGTAPNAPAP